MDSLPNVDVCVSIQAIASELSKTIEKANSLAIEYAKSTTQTRSLNQENTYHMEKILNKELLQSLDGGPLLNLLNRTGRNQATQQQTIDANSVSIASLASTSTSYLAQTRILQPFLRSSFVGNVETSSSSVTSNQDQSLNVGIDRSPVPVKFAYPSGDLDGIYVKRVFKNKAELMLRMQKWALDWNFEYTPHWSDKSRVILGCVDDKCSWKMRATRISPSDFFVVKKYIHEHTCDTTHRKANHKHASAELLGNLLCSHYAEKKEGLKPKQIIEQVRKEFGVQINYKKAWKAKEKAEYLIRGSPEDSYLNLAKWLYMAQGSNPGSLAYIERELDDSFKYVFFAFGASIRGFQLMRRVIAVDGTFLKGKFRGTLVAATAQDGDFHLYPIAFGIIDSENKAAWTWFFLCLQNAIPDASDLVFVSDRAASIAAGLSTVYPLAHHGLCRFHLMNNVQSTFKGGAFLVLVEAAANAYTVHEFQYIFSEIERSNPQLAAYLVKAKFEKWARCYSPTNRYNMMTTNIAESLNSLLKEPRDMPILSLFETIRLTLTSWFCERRELASKHDKLLTPNVGKQMVLRFNKAMSFVVYQVNHHVFEVIDERRKFIVDLGRRSCTCFVFDLEKIPCAHAIAAAKRSFVDENKLASYLYTTGVFGEAYSESVHPNGDVSTWTFPEDIINYFCPPPGTKRSSGRPPKKRKRSAGEYGVPNSKKQKHACGRCGREGHNKTTCNTALN